MPRLRFHHWMLAASPLFSCKQLAGDCVRYSVELTEPACSFGFAVGWGLNDEGAIAGYYGCLAFSERAFVWDGVTFIPIPTPPEKPDARAFAVNNQLQVVGRMGAPYHAFLYSNGRTLDLGTLPGGNISEALAINDAGIVCGYWGNSSTGNPALHAFAWNGEMTDLNLPVGPNNVAYDINEMGAICGWMGQASFLNSSAFLWDGGVTTPLGVPKGAQATSAWALNNLNQVCGSIHYPNPDGPLIRKPFIWSEGVMTELPVLPGYISGFARGINDEGAVVGYCAGGDPEDGLHPAFIWRDGVMTSLGDLIADDSRVTLVDANGINDAGQITGHAFMDGDGFAYLLTPIPPQPGDVNCDWLVNIDDLFEVIASWGPCGELQPCSADLDPPGGNGVVDIDDLFAVINGWT